MNYLDTMSKHDLRKAISYLLYKKMKRRDTSEDAELSKQLKTELLRRETKQ